MTAKAKKTAQSQINASYAYEKRALERIAAIVLSPHEQDVYDALQVIKAHYDGNRARAIKQAILAHANELKGE